jgi:phage-related baseplate assembly protein
MSDLQFVEIDAELIAKELIQDFEDETGETLYPGDERRIFLQNFLPVLVGLKNDLNNTIKQMLLRYSSGDNLTALCNDWFGVIRLAAQKANVTLRFTLSAIQVSNVIIPAGSRVTPDGIIFFSTKEELVISAGDSTGDVTAESVNAGASYNGYTAGQIKFIVDPVPFVQSVSNTNTSYSGTDIEADDDLRLRAQISPESYSVAGPAGAYEYWAKTADASISDVKVTSPSAGVVDVVVLLDGGQIPDSDMLEKVENILLADDIRPLTDNVNVLAPTPVSYDIDFIYYISQADQSQESIIRGLIEDSGGAVDEYQTWQNDKLGRDVNPDELRKKVLNAGALRLTITSPTLDTVDDDEVAEVGTVNVTYGGLV